MYEGEILEPNRERGIFVNSCKRLALFSLLMLVLIALSSCALTGDELKPDKDHSIVRFVVKNPKYSTRFSQMAIPSDTESFGIVAKESGSGTLIKSSKAFGTEEYLTMEMKLPGDRVYSFYFMGIDSNDSLTCMNFLKNIYLLSGEATSLSVSMIPIEKSIFPTDASLANVLFKEPKYSYEEPKYVDWTRAYYYFTFTATDLGTFFEDLSSEDHYYTKYSFDLWNGKEFYLTSNYYWRDYESNYSYSYISKIDSNTVQAQVPVYFPIKYHDDGTPYPYTDGTFSFYSPNNFGGLGAGLYNSVNFSELNAEITIVIE
ncbi:hypothetical protein AT15_03665 [Kosmotoga arenicorallina S304]|uniref:Uncharacterized protein n=1 Tax=Kosmotoga arenicorallina S304 TaxID=1453497 RepID=A0A182C830_9BACT|nr:hypothetical protein [Kosmotoga arenicorallina]OAA31934.1 hypothetical protein AT15_03665 [Kosmotoga arenicorallina S304]